MGLRRLWGPMAVTAMLVAGCGSGARIAPAVVRATPASGLYDVPRSIVVSHLAPGEVVTISASTPSPGGLWAASATYKANRAGVVDLSRAAARSGTYHGVSAMGLFWSQRLVHAGSDGVSPTVTTLSVSADGRRIGSAKVTQVLGGPGVTEHVATLAGTGFVGRYFTPPGGGRHPAVVVWGGSEGGLGDSPAFAELLASHGIAALGLAYFDEPGLPCALGGVRLEYFEKAIEWLRSRPQVDPRRVWILSASRGSEAELLVAAHWPKLVHGVIAAAPSSVVWGPVSGQCQAGALTSWTLDGKPLNTTISYGTPTRSPDGSISSRNMFLSGLDGPFAAAARIPIEHFKGPVMLISGGDDQLWPSPVFADRIMASLRAGSAAHVHLNYPSAGHLVLSIPSGPAGPVEQRGATGFLIDLGGSEAADEAAYLSDWRLAGSDRLHPVALMAYGQPRGQRSGGQGSGVRPRRGVGR